MAHYLPCYLICCKNVDFCRLSGRVLLLLGIYRDELRWELFKVLQLECLVLHSIKFPHHLNHRAYFQGIVSIFSELYSYLFLDIQVYIFLIFLRHCLFQDQFIHLLNLCLTLYVWWKRNLDEILGLLVFNY